ncbi:MULTISPECIES: quinolinate synthase NadA [Lactococcus]|uniref:Quinolinate synthase n=1 Tax=Lactococcus formosensis TaxID=1281486 RepID=A0A9X4SC10_9LACT|nr:MULTISPECIES: quinolinate synthase NadA [Lactococcus]MDG6112488.1 quinolinate synthase NadA [Lactococcus formosensis]MDG6114540.1 quinolinate synthase NadA [Lactococcus formosensis]MDG6116684.1 quinolinate synthase NadA [Lactococcus formosensis]MDG6118738.1 quinolinate synthase NadA [Lactococcus formosensis]MDG6120766.1 quinolinate synthase NadA [Lactococcus formosensis]
MDILDIKRQARLEKYYAEAPEEQIERIREIKNHFGDELMIVAHHYQKDEIVQFADAVGDSLKLAQIAATNKTAKKIIFCGVTFMAETADILTDNSQKVIFPDPTAGCSLADMANSFQITKAWKFLKNRYSSSDIIPITYVNSSAAIKSFVGKHNGVVVTSGNARNIIEWALTRGKYLFFLPDQNLGRNISIQLGVSQEALALWKPLSEELIENNPEKTRIILWDGYCSVHQQFTVRQIKNLRNLYPDIKIIVHPECTNEVVNASDEMGSTADIINYIHKSPVGSRIAVGTDNNLVIRLQRLFSDRKVMLLNPIACSCVLMNRIDLPHLALTMDNLIQRPEELNIVKVDNETSHFAKIALENMLKLS